MAVLSGHQNQCRCVYTRPTERARDSPLLRSTSIQGSVRTHAQSWTARRHLHIHIHIHVHMSSTSAREAERMWDEARQWEESLRAAGKLQARTIALYGQDVRRFLAWFVWRVREREVEQERAQHREHRDLGTATPEEAMAYRMYLLERGLGRSAVNRALTSLRLFFAMRSQLYPEAPDSSNPFRDIPTVPRPPRNA
jgi:hypothetical protein